MSRWPVTGDRVWSEICASPGTRAGPGVRDFIVCLLWDLQWQSAAAAEICEIRDLRSEIRDLRARACVYWYWWCVCVWWGGLVGAVGVWVCVVSIASEPEPEPVQYL